MIVEFSALVPLLQGMLALLLLVACGYLLHQFVRAEQSCRAPRRPAPATRQGSWLSNLVKG